MSTIRIPENVQRDLNSFLHTTTIDNRAYPLTFAYRAVQAAFKSLADNIPQLSVEAADAVRRATATYGENAGHVEFLRQVLLSGPARYAINPHPVPCHVCGTQAQQGHLENCPFYRS